MKSLWGVPFAGPLPDRYERTWKHEVPDGYRGYPFRRWLPPEETGNAIFDVTGAVGEIVEVPIGAQNQRHVESVWKIGYPELWRWFQDESNTMFRYNGIVFVKADW